jgi:serine/threonine protein kinase
MSDPIPYDRRRQEAQKLAAMILARQAAGEALSDAAVLETHGDLQPELAEELEYARQIRLGVAAGERARAMTPSDPVLSWEALERPIETDEDDDGLAEFQGAKPQVAGYLVLDEIGRGGQGTVYRAIQESTDRPVAIKVMAVRAGSRHRTRIEREAKLLASLRHPHIVGVIERTQTSTGLFCLVMEFVEGRDLDAYWADGVPSGQAGTRQLVELFIKLAQAIGATHARGIVHRDLKPTNIKVDAQGEPRILDFGLARVMAGPASRTITATGQILGSLPWSSPEQAGGGSPDVGPPSDVYSLGVMLYQALTGRFPYPVDGSFLDLLIHIAKTIPPAPSLLLGSRPTPPALDRVVLRALAKRPGDRYADGNALADALQSALRNERGGSAFRGRLRRAASIAAAVSLCTCSLSTGWHVPARQTTRVQTVFALPRVTNSVGMLLIRVPAGRFVMGSATGEEACPAGAPQQLVTIPSAYYLGATEVTRRQYWAVMHGDPSEPKWAGPDLPVQRVTWDEAREFCKRLSAREGRHYRLPTSDEWEYACKAGATDPFGGDGTLDSVGWYVGNSGGAVHPVGGKLPNVWGFYDAHGNVAEWCSDLAPSALRRPMAVIRGGSALRTAHECRAASSKIVPTDARFDDVGFRIALDP